MIAVVGDRDPRYLTHRELDADARADAARGRRRAGWRPTAPRPAGSIGSTHSGSCQARRTATNAPVFAGIEHARTRRRAHPGNVRRLPAHGGRVRPQRGRHPRGGPRRDRTGRRSPRRLAACVQPRRRGAAGDDGPGDACRRAVRAGRRSQGSTGATTASTRPVLDRLVAAGLVVSATAPDAGVEAVELPDHPFYVATLFQPQVGSSETGALHPLIAALIAAAAGVGSGLRSRARALNICGSPPISRGRCATPPGPLPPPPRRTRSSTRAQRSRVAMPLDADERLLSALLGGAFLVVAVVLALTAGGGRAPGPVDVGVLVLAFAALANVEFEIGTGAAIPTQLVFVPMLFLLPLGWVPLAVAAAYWMSLNADVVRGRRHRERVLVLLCSCWYVIGPVLVLLAFGDGPPRWALWPVYGRPSPPSSAQISPAPPCASGGPWPAGHGGCSRPPGSPTASTPPSPRSGFWPPSRRSACTTPSCSSCRWRSSSPSSPASAAAASPRRSSCGGR